MSEKFFDMEKLEAQMAENRAIGEQRRREGSAMGGFTTVDLRDWMDLCELAGVPAVPAYLIAEADTYDLLQSADEAPSAEVAEFWRKVEAWKKRVGDGWMYRWSCCSCAEVKYRLGHGKADWHPDIANQFYLQDLRAFDLIYEHPLEQIGAWARPWFQFDMLDGYPVEYRVFVEDDHVVGISNYYLQRALPDDEAVRADLGRIYAHTEKLIAYQRKPINCPQAGERIHGKLKNWWTADFARLPSGAVLFLEGGPAHFVGGGAHSCCFPVGNVRGVALAAPSTSEAA